MSKLKELCELINKADFGIGISEAYYANSEINFESDVTKTGAYLRYKIIADEQELIVYEKLVYDAGGRVIPISQKSYDIDNVDEIMNDLSNTFSRLAEIDTVLEINFNDFEEYSVPRSTKEWKKEFIGELADMFGSPRIAILSGGIKLIVAFEEDTNLIKVVLAKGIFFEDEKTLLHGFVSESNYKEVLAVIEKIYNDFKYKFYDIDSIVDELRNLEN